MEYRQYQKDVSNGNITDSKSFKFKSRIIRRTPANNNRKNVEAVPLK